MNVNDIINSPASDIKRFSEQQINQAYQTLKSAFNKRVSTFEKHGRQTALPSSLRTGMKSSKGMSQAEKQAEILKASAFMRGSRSTYSGWKKSEMQRMEELNERLEGDYHFNNLDDFLKYGKFLGEMQDRLGTMWKYESSQVRELYFQANRLNVDPNQFMKNYEYWLDHAEELQNAEPLNYKGRNVKASDYARKLKLPKISEYYEDNPDRSTSKKLSKKRKK